jgi:hypothetical protein
MDAREKKRKILIKFFGSPPIRWKAELISALTNPHPDQHFFFRGAGNPNG